MQSQIKINSFTDNNIRSVIKYTAYILYLYSSLFSNTTLYLNSTYLHKHSYKQTKLFLRYLDFSNTSIKTRGIHTYGVNKVLLDKSYVYYKRLFSLFFSLGSTSKTVFYLSFSADLLKLGYLLSSKGLYGDKFNLHNSLNYTTPTQSNKYVKRMLLRLIKVKPDYLVILDNSMSSRVDNFVKKLPSYIISFNTLKLHHYNIPAPISNTLFKLSFVYSLYYFYNTGMRSCYMLKLKVMLHRLITIKKLL